MREKDYYLLFRKRDVEKTRGDLALALWYSALKDYARRTKPDKTGFKRIKSSLFEEDFAMERRRAWRYNQRLEELGLIVIDKAHRGGRTWVGVKILK